MTQYTASVRNTAAQRVTRVLAAHLEDLAIKVLTALIVLLLRARAAAIAWDCRLTLALRSVHIIAHTKHISMAKHYAEQDSVLEIELDRLKNAEAHLVRSNAELKEAFQQEESDKEYKQALEENIVVIAKYRAQVCRLYYCTWCHCQPTKVVP